MSEMLPSLNALHAFEVAARLCSFTQAGRELGVTQTAVSHQIKQLEDELGVLLFRRTGRGLELSDAGRAWQAELSTVFGRLREVNQRLRSRPKNARPALSLTTLPSFGARWLVPRLGGFLARHPEVDLRISTSEALVDFTTERVDVGIRLGHGRYPGLHRDRLFDDSFLVVASPGKAARLKRPSDLLHHTLLSDDHAAAWARFFAAQGLPPFEQARHHQLTDSGMLVEAAARGQGVGLARSSLIQEELRSGRLVIVFPRLEPLSLGHAYFLVGLRESFRRPEVRAFREWLLGEVKGA